MIGPHHEQRTSYNTWCDMICLQDPIIVTMLNRIGDWLGVPSTWFEPLQIVRYMEGQEYRPHVDVHNQYMFFPRVLTMLLYLNTVNETQGASGGETFFPDVPAADNNHYSQQQQQQRGIKITPNKGSGALFSLLKFDGNEAEIDVLAKHASLPVIQDQSATVKAMKYLANLWIHPRSYSDVVDWNCTTVIGKVEVVD
jgi:prolyl 4-hydroxylase